MNTSAFVTEDSVVFQTDLMPFWNHDNRNGCRFLLFGPDFVYSVLRWILIWLFTKAGKNFGKII